MWSACLPFGVSTGAGFRGAEPARVLALVLVWRVPSFCPLSRFVFGALYLKYALIRILRGFLEGFPCWMWVCIACVLCVACVALYACGVRRIKGLRRVCLYFSSSLPSFSSLCLLLSFTLSALFWLSFACPLALSLWLFGCVGFSFSLSGYTQKERAQSVFLASSLVLLWVALSG